MTATYTFYVCRCPELRLPTDFSVRGDANKSDSSGNSARVSAYDNVTNGASTQSQLSDDDTQVFLYKIYKFYSFTHLLIFCPETCSNR